MFLGVSWEGSREPLGGNLGPVRVSWGPPVGFLGPLGNPLGPPGSSSGRKVRHVRSGSPSRRALGAVLGASWAGGSCHLVPSALQDHLP
eukprot:2876916-Pyramimonas_sp.AAC.1